MDSLPLNKLDCNSLDLVLTLCVDHGDLSALGAPTGSGSGWIPNAVAARGWLHRACHQDQRRAERLSDRLDLRWADEVALTRAANANELRSLAAHATCPPIERHRGLLWSLLTDARPDVRCLGSALGRTWIVQACAPAAIGEGARASR
ncbi:MAG: hypothetical protein AAF682_01115 [Planctomycetota bacterium]